MLTFTVPSSTTEASYHVQVDPQKGGNVWRCGCKGFAFKGTCSHIRWMKWRIANHLFAEPGPVKKELIEHVR